MSQVVVVYPPEGDDPRYSVWTGDCLNPGVELARCSTREGANRVAVLLGMSLPVHCVMQLAENGLPYVGPLEEQRRAAAKKEGI